MIKRNKIISSEKNKTKIFYLSRGRLITKQKKKTRNKMSKAGKPLGMLNVRKPV